MEERSALIATHISPKLSTDSHENKEHIKRPNSTRSNASNTSQTLNLSESPKPQRRYTIDEALDAIGIGMFQKRVLIVTGGLWASNAAEIVILTFLLPILKIEWNLEQGIDAIVGASVFIGMFIGSIFWSNLSNKYGRRRCIRLCIVGQILFGVSCGMAPNIYWMSGLRLFHGICLGGSTVGFKLCSECCSQHGRDKLFFYQLSFWVIGSVLNMCIAWIVLDILDWKWYLIISSISLFVLLLFSFCISESPKWLIMKKDIDDAQITLFKAAKLNHKLLPSGSLKSSNHFVYGNNCDSPKTVINSEWKQIFSAQYYVTSITIYIICFCCIFGYYGISILSKRFFDRHSQTDNEWMIYLKMMISICSEIVCLCIATRFGTKSPLMVSFIIFLICNGALMLPNVQDNDIVSVALIFIGRMSVFHAFLLLYIYINAHYSSIIRDDAIEFVYIIGNIAGIVTVFVSQWNNIRWSLYIYALCGLMAFIASGMLKIGGIHERSQLMPSVDYKSIEDHKHEMHHMHHVEKIEENQVKMNSIDFVSM